jgi:hypothetical protein
VPATSNQHQQPTGATISSGKKTATNNQQSINRTKNWQSAIQQPAEQRANRQPNQATNSEQPANSNQQPATSNQQPAAITSNQQQQPTTAASKQRQANSNQKATSQQPATSNRQTVPPSISNPAARRAAEFFSQPASD